MGDVSSPNFFRAPSGPGWLVINKSINVDLPIDVVMKINAKIRKGR